MGDEDSNSEKKQVVEQQSYLSDDLIIQEILTRLPVKSILRFKSVSKQWYSTLSSSDFANAHLMKSPLAYPSAPVNTLFIKDHNNCCYLFSYEDDQVSGNFEDYLVRLDPEFEFEKTFVQLTGSCNGLVCLIPVSHEYFILWNPATRKMHKYVTDVYLRRTDDFKSIRHIGCGFWYSSIVDDYKFIRILKGILGADDTNTNYIVHIFSLRENKWTRFDFDFGHDFFATGRAILANDRLCWPVLSPSAGHIVLSFDLVVERFDVVKLDYMNCLGVMGGCLSMYDSGSADKDDKLMHIYESHGVILKSIDFPKGLRLGMGSRMIGFTRTGKCFVTGALTDGVSDFENRILGVVDTGTKILQYTTLFRFDEMIDIARYVPSLVSPFPFEKLSTA